MHAGGSLSNSAPLKRFRMRNCNQPNSKIESHYRVSVSVTPNTSSQPFHL